MKLVKREGFHRKRYQKQFVSDRRIPIDTLNKYGLSLEAYKVILLRQRMTCPICKIKLDGHRTVIDHDHGTGKVRGILHIKCNALLGMADDSLGILDNAMSYLKGSV